MPFKETAVKVAEMNASKSTEGARGKFIGSSVANFVKVTVQTLLLPEPVLEFLQNSASTLQSLHDQDQQVINEAIDQNDEGPAEFGANERNRLMDPAQFWSKLSKLLDEAGSEWQGMADQIWAFGPKRVGPNLLVDRTGGSSRR